MALNYAERATQYAKDVVSGKVVAGRLVRLACERHLRDLERDDIVFDHAAANRYCFFVEQMPHHKGVWARRGEKIKLEGWQCFSEASLFGWLRVSDGLRRFRESYEEIARKNAKSTKAAACGNYLFCADGEFGSEVYSGATSIKQAMEVFIPARVQMERSPEIRNRFGVEIQNQQLLVKKEDGSKFEPIIAKPGDGSSPHGVIIDEYHEHKTDEQYESMQTGMGARAMGGAPLLRVITTAGTLIGGPCHKMRQKAERVLEQQEEDDQFFALVFTIDSDDEWTTTEGLLKANPNIDVSVSREYLEKQVQSALQDPSKQSMVKRKHFNVWTTAADQWMSMEAWKHAEDLTLKQSDVEGCPVHFSIDLSSSGDIAGYAKVFRRNGDYLCVDPKFYLPEDTVNKDDNSHYQGWAASGHLTVTPGAVIDEEFIIHDLLRDMERCGVEAVGTDPWQSRNIEQRLEREGATAIQVAQNFETMSRPMQRVQALVNDGRFRHDGNPIMSWMMANTSARWDPSGRYCRPVKGGDERQKIDGATMVISAMALFDVDAPKRKSKYEDQGLTVLGG